MRLGKSLVAAGALALSLTGLSTGANAQVDPNLPEYQRVSGISGSVRSVGSDTLNNLMTLWLEEFQRQYAGVEFSVTGAGSGTAPTALIEGSGEFGPMSRAMRQSEIDAFEQRYGYPPTAVPVAIDLLAVYVHRDNPIEGMSIAQVDGVFSATRRCGGSDITRWGQLGLTGPWANRDFTLYSRNAVSGTYGYFRDNALCGGDFKPTINEQPGSSSVVQGVSESINGIGYSGIGYLTSGVRAIPLGKEAGQYFEPNAENAATGDYPLARYLYVYVNKHPNDGLSPTVREFFQMVLSRQGQDVVNRDGFVPLPEAAASRFRRDLGLE